MMDILMGIPPIHPAAATSSDVMFWALIGLLVVLFVVATIFWVVGSRRIAQRQSQVKEAGRQYAASPKPYGDEQPQVHSRQEEMLLRR